MSLKKLHNFSVRSTQPSFPMQIEECLVCSEIDANVLFKPCLHMIACDSKHYVKLLQSLLQINPQTGLIMIIVL